MSVIVLIILGGRKLDLSIVAKRVTNRCEASRLGEIGKHTPDDSPTVWMRENTMIRYLGWLSEELNHMRGKGEIPHVIRDVDWVHMMTEFGCKRGFSAFASSRRD
jgi:hypothetical protein